RLRDARVRLWPAIAIELPVVANLSDEVEIEVADDELLVFARPVATDDVSPRVGELTGSVEVDREVAVLVVLAADAVRAGPVIAVRPGGGRLFELPETVAEPVFRGMGVDPELRAVRPEHPPSLGKVPITADVHADRTDGRVDERVAEVAGPEVEL